MLHVLKKKKVWIPVLIVALVVGLVVWKRGQDAKPQYTTEPVKRQDLVQTVSATGTVKAAEAINVTPKVSGRIVKLAAKVGAKVSPGQLLVQLEAGDAQSAVLAARANVKSAEAALAKLKAGAQVESIEVARAAVAAAETALQNARQSYENTKATQAQAVANAFGQLVGLQVTAVPSKTNLSTATLAITGTYIGKDMGSYVVRMQNASSLYFTTSGLEAVTGEASRSTSTPLGVQGLRIQVSASGTIVEGDTWTIAIPNAANASYASYAAAYEASLVAEKQQVDAAGAAVKTAEQALAQAKAQLALTEAPARPYDIQSAEAAVDAAQAQLIRAQADLADRALISPVAGVVTQVNNEVGEVASPSKPVLVVLTEGDREIKVQVPESDIAKLNVSQAADLTLDALGSTEHFAGHISFIDPASTVLSEVVYYQVTVLFDSKDERIKPGMTANVDITTAERKAVLVVPLRAVKYDESRSAYVEVVVGELLERRAVQVGLRGDEGLAEVLEGLSEGELVVTFKQQPK